MGEDRTKAVVDLKMPTTIKELRSELGTINFLRKLFPNLATIIDPLVALTRKSVENSFKDIAKPLGIGTGRCFYQ